VHLLWSTEVIIRLIDDHFLTFLRLGASFADPSLDLFVITEVTDACTYNCCKQTSCKSFVRVCKFPFTFPQWTVNYVQPKIIGNIRRGEYATNAAKSNSLVGWSLLPYKTNTPSRVGLEPLKLLCKKDQADGRVFFL